MGNNSQLVWIITQVHVTTIIWYKKGQLQIKNGENNFFLVTAPHVYNYVLYHEY